MFQCLNADQRRSLNSVCVVAVEFRICFQLQNGSLADQKPSVLEPIFSISEIVLSRC